MLSRTDGRRKSITTVQSSKFQLWLENIEDGGNAEWSKKATWETEDELNSNSNLSSSEELKQILGEFQFELESRNDHHSVMPNLVSQTRRFSPLDCHSLDDYCSSPSSLESLPPRDFLYLNDSVDSNSNPTLSARRISPYDINSTSFPLQSVFELPVSLPRTRSDLPSRPISTSTFNQLEIPSIKRRTSLPIESIKRLPSKAVAILGLRKETGRKSFDSSGPAISTPSTTSISRFNFFSGKLSRSTSTSAMTKPKKKHSHTPSHSLPFFTTTLPSPTKSIQSRINPYSAPPTPNIPASAKFDSFQDCFNATPTSLTPFQLPLHSFSDQIGRPKFWTRDSGKTNYSESSNKSRLSSWSPPVNWITEVRGNDGIENLEELERLVDQ